jgi:hypothetical protein
MTAYTFENAVSKKFVALKICRLIVGHVATALPLRVFIFFLKKFKNEKKGGLSYIWPSIIKTSPLQLCYTLKA